MKSWPRSAYLTVVVLVALFLGVMRWVYTETREAYRAVGFNDGQIYQREQTLKTIAQALSVEDCRKYQSVPTVEFLSVKSNSLYMLTGADKRTATFCSRD